MQRDPQKGLGEQVCENTCDEYETDRFPPPNGVAETNHSFNEDRDGKSGNHFFTKRMMRKMIKPITRATLTQTHASAMKNRVLGDMAPRLNFDSTSRSSG